MSVVAAQEIEKIEREQWHQHFERLGRIPTPESHAVDVGMRVAALVEQRMKEMVCERCGEDREIAFDERIREGWCGKCDAPINGITRAQFEAEKEETR